MNFQGQIKIFIHCILGLVKISVHSQVDSFRERYEIEKLPQNPTDINFFALY